MPDLSMKTWKTSALPWEERLIAVTGKSYQRKHLMGDGDTGMQVLLVRYPTGTVTPWHRHPCGHGLFVLEGTLRTHEGTHGVGDFVWFPEGNIGEHGATADEPVTALFFTNKPFDIEFVEAPQLSSRP